MSGVIMDMVLAAAAFSLSLASRVGVVVGTCGACATAELVVLVGVVVALLFLRPAETFFHLSRIAMVFVVDNSYLKICLCFCSSNYFVEGNSQQGVCCGFVFALNSLLFEFGGTI